MPPGILLLNPAIPDFAAHDFWLRPYGLLRAAGMLRGRAEMRLFDYMDRWAAPGPVESDAWGRGKYLAQPMPKPPPLADVPRRYRRYGRPREEFRAFLQAQPPFDAALIQTGMTYWYPGVAEAIADLRARSAATRIVLGGVYATLCPAHARGLGADLVIEGADLRPLEQALGLDLDPAQPALWEAYDRLPTGVVKLSDGCPFHCTYCSVPRTTGGFVPRPLHVVCAELDLLLRLGARNIAFYDDALLHQPESALLPFLEAVQARGARVNLHSPNALHARLLTPEIARAMVRAGVASFFLGFESRADDWQRRTGGKVSGADLASAVEALRSAGAPSAAITAYLLLGHPDHDAQGLEESLRFVHGLGVRAMLSEFSPLPGTPDGERCRRWTDLDEPLNHNKTAFPIRLLGERQVDRLKDLCRQWNRRVG